MNHPNSLRWQASASSQAQAHGSSPSRSWSRQGFTLVELLVVIAIISLISGLVVPGLIEARERAKVTQCSSNLRQIYGFALAYSDKGGSGSFPFGKTKASLAHESLNELLKLDADRLEPELFVCPGNPTKPADRESDGSFALDSETLGYAWIAKRTKSSSARKPLACCKHVEGHVDEDGEHSGHRGGVNVLYTDGSVKFVSTAELDPDTLLAPGLTR